MSGGAITTYTFGRGPLGVTVEERRGGTRVAIASVSDDSQAEALELPVDGMIMAVTVGGQRFVTSGMRLANVRKHLANPERPMTLTVLSDVDLSAKVSAAPTVAVEAKAAVTQQSLLDAGLEIRPFEFGPGALGLALDDCSKKDAFSKALAVSEVNPGSLAAALKVPLDAIVVSVGETEVLGMGKTQLLQRIGRAQRPLVLWLAVEPPPAPELLTYTFGPGALGLSLADGKDAKDGSNCVIIDDVAKGSAAEAQGASAGSILVMLNDLPLTGMGRAQVVRVIGKAKRPLTLAVSPQVTPALPLAYVV